MTARQLSVIKKALDFMIGSSIALELTEAEKLELLEVRVLVMEAEVEAEISEL